jgi:hypothetical protein
MDCDGTKNGYDLALDARHRRRRSRAGHRVGGRRTSTTARRIAEGHADAVSRSIFHFGEFTVPQAKAISPPRHRSPRPSPRTPRPRNDPRMKELEEGHRPEPRFQKRTKAVAPAPASFPSPSARRHPRNHPDRLYERIRLKAFAERTAIYLEHLPHELWEKGKNSARPSLLEVRVNCEQNSLVYVVRPRAAESATPKPGGQPRNCIPPLDFEDGPARQPGSQAMTAQPRIARSRARTRRVRTAANRRIFAFVAIFTLLLAGPCGSCCGRKSAAAPCWFRRTVRAAGPRRPSASPRRRPPRAPRGPPSSPPRANSRRWKKP